MKIRKLIMGGRALLFLTLVVVILLAATNVYAKTRTTGGGDMPFYARIEAGEILHTEQWAVIVFYRPPECVPGDFNLLDFYDFAAFDCGPYTTDGFIIWDGEPWISNPVQINLHGLGAVPVWFVSWPELQAAVDENNGVLTVTDLRGMESLITGTASYYSEVLHPTGGAKVPMIEFDAHGNLDDGTTFQVHVILVYKGTSVIRIEFR